ncbi:hypothetical protein Acy02nite_55450 [Actinoplanes cyaneus]|uniref:Uncharacterized protein n=1 Tax=Actinoplanes cyaneus TaxID=52696 RepID=A0A919IKR4_9ACTN|nr:hypothetical protein [Actinoplanes cyaneus]MCW2140036.1 hypothetical protein [Actinoplanes cyaneus]GID67664.1 hypothetical protein Acy02nite_55450 [Actinoplanes cyaneus]
MRQTLKDLAFSEHSEWFGLGPLALAVLAGVRAFAADEPFARWAWSSIAVLMLILCTAYVVWTRKKRS